LYDYGLGGIYMLKENVSERIAQIISRNFGVKVVIQGDRACTDGRTIVLPNIPEMEPNVQDLYLALILHEAGHVKYTPPMECFCYEHHWITNCIEDVRIELKIEKIFGGAKNLFKNLFSYAIAKWEPVNAEDQILKNIGQNIYSTLRFKNNVLSPISLSTWDKISDLVRVTKTYKDSYDLAWQICERLGYQKDEKLEESKDGMDKLKEEKKSIEDEKKEKSKELKKINKELEKLKKELKDAKKKDADDSSKEGNEGSASDDGENGNESPVEKSDESDNPNGDKLSLNPDGDIDGDKYETEVDETDENIDDELIDGEIDLNGTPDPKGDKITPHPDGDKKMEIKAKIQELKEEKEEIQELIDTLQEVKGNLKSLADAKNEILKFFKEALNKDDTTKILIKELIEQAYVEIIGDGKNQRHIPVTTAYDKFVKLDPDLKGKNEWLSNNIQNEINLFSRIINQALYSQKKSQYKYAKEEGFLDTRALHAYRVKRDTQIFSKIENKQVRDIAISIAIDCSGSMNGYMHQVKDASFVLSGTFTNLNINHEIIGFTTKDFFKKSIISNIDNIDRFNRFEELYHLIVKTFDNKDNSAITNLKAMRENVDGESLLWITERLLKRKEGRKILIVISDGMPVAACDNGILARDLVSTVKLIEATGVQVIAFGINGDFCKHFYTEWVQLKKNFHSDLCKQVFKYLIEKQTQKVKISSAQFNRLMQTYLR